MIPLVPADNRLLLAMPCIIFAMLLGLAELRGEPADTDSAARILDETGVQGGLVVHLGCGDGRLTAALRADDRYLVHGLDRDAKNVDTARAHFRAMRLHGEVTADVLTGQRLPYTDNLVNLLVAEDLGDVAIEEVMRVLVPHGVAFFASGNEWTKTVKPWPEGMDQWTHWRHAADGNMVSRDQLVGPPRHVQWVEGPLWQRHHGIVPSITTMVSAGGRIFAIADEVPLGVAGGADRWHLIARDAFNGRLLWRRPIGDWGSEAWSYWTEGHGARFNHPIHVRKRLVAMGDRVFVTLGYNAPVSAIDAATGETVATYEGTQYTDEIVCRDGTLYLSVNDREQRPWPGEGVSPRPTSKELSQKRIWAVDVESGAVRWKSEPLTGRSSKPDRLGSMQHVNLTAATSGVFLVDEKDVVCLDPKTGQTRWRSARLFREQPPEKPHNVSYLYHCLNDVNLNVMILYRGVLLVLHPREQPSWVWRTPAVLQAIDPDSGKELWRFEATPITCLDEPDLLGIGGLVWLPDRQKQTAIGLDPATGRVVKTLSIKDALAVGHHHRCYPNRATENYLILGRRGAEFVDLATGQVDQYHWARGACRYGHMPANGLLYRPPDPCKCYTSGKLQGFFALASQHAAASFTKSLTDEGAYQRGPAYDAVDPPAETPDAGAWPTYRHDPARSGFTPTSVPRPLKPLWEAPIGGKLSSPVIAGGKLFVSAVDRHQVHCVDAASGKAIWSHTASGRVDSPPTIYRGTALFGCADGSVTCLRSSDGQLVWRRRVAPGTRLVMARGRLESAWPVPGSVLVADGIVYCTAGRSSFLDGGVYACSLDAATGELLQRTQINEVQPFVPSGNRLPPEAVGALADILVTDGQAVYLRHRKLDFTTPPKLSPGLAPGGPNRRLIADGGFLNEQWFHRAFWHYGQIQGNLMVVDPRQVYTAAASRSGDDNFAFYVPAGARRDRVSRSDGTDKTGWLVNTAVQYGGYHLFARSHTPSPTEKNGQAARRSKARPATGDRWHHDKFPIAPWAMVVADDTLLIAGFPDPIDVDDPWATLEGRRGGVIRMLSKTDGTMSAEIKLPSPPVWDGVAAAYGRVYLSTKSGKVLCLGSASVP